MITLEGIPQKYLQEKPLKEPPQRYPLKVPFKGFPKETLDRFRSMVPPHALLAEMPHSQRCPTQNV